MTEQEPTDLEKAAKWAKEFDRMMRGERTPQEIEEARAREVVRPRISPKAHDRLMNTRIGPGPSGDVLSIRIGPNCADGFFSTRDESDAPRTEMSRRIHELPLGEDIDILQER